MVQRNASAPDTEPEERKFEIPSEGEHLLQVVDVLEDIDDDPDVVHAKLEVIGGKEEGRSLLHRCNLDDSQKAFFFTRMLLKAISEPYKGKDFPIDTDMWIGRQFYATVGHSGDGKYANITMFNFDKKIEQGDPRAEAHSNKKSDDEAAWDDDL